MCVCICHHAYYLDNLLQPRRGILAVHVGFQTPPVLPHSQAVINEPTKPVKHSIRGNTGGLLWPYPYLRADSISP